MSTKKPTRDEMDQVIARLRDGWSWETACSEVFGVPPSPVLTALIFRLKVDKPMRRLLIANRRDIPDEMLSITHERFLREAYEALQWGRATGDGRLILAAATARAEAAGVLSPPSDDAETVRLRRMSEVNQIAFLQKGVELIESIQRRLSERGVVIDQNAPQLENSGGSSAKSATSSPPSPSPTP